MNTLSVKYNEIYYQINDTLTYIYGKSVIKAVIFTLVIWLIFTVIL